VIEECFTEIEPLLGTATACAAVGRARATHYRRLKPGRTTPRKPRPSPPNKLTDDEVEGVLRVLRSERFCDCSPAQVYFTLLDEGVYLASESTFYRVLRSNDEVRERRRQATHPAKVKPELVADTPLVVWSWDITKLKGPKRGEYFDLYVVLDIFSRYVVAWCVAPSESGELAKELIADAVARHRVPPGQLTIHADRGSSMTSNPVTELLTFLGIGRSHSRPHVSNDNPYSESQFKTMKYCPAFPERFGSIADARSFCEAFFNYYNHEHRHSGIGYHTPASVHYGTAGEVRAQRAETLEAAYVANPTRFGKRRPRPPKLPTVAWINEPVPAGEIESEAGRGCPMPARFVSVDCREEEAS
jgi:putative transposase